MKKKIIGILIVIIVIISCGVGCFIYQGNVKQENIDKEISKIARWESEFSKAEQREEKLTILKTLMAEEKKYEKSEKFYEEVLEKYKGVILDQQKIFAEEYKNRIEENKVKNLETSEDIELIKKKQNNLIELLSVIEEEKTITISSESEYTKYIQEIKSLTESYSERIASVEEAKRKAEEEAKRKAEEEKKKAAEEKAKTHYENQYFSVDVPNEWIGIWSVTPGENYRDNSSAIAVYDASTGPGGGGAEIYVLQINFETDRLGYGDFALPSGGTYVGKTSGGKFVFIMAEAGAGFFSAGATITLK